jgi:hypothetical protein
MAPSEPARPWTGYGPPPPSRIPKTRIGFELDGQDYPVTLFYGTGDNIHWGSPDELQLLTPTLLPNGAIPMEPPEGIEQQPFVHVHNSYHESGQRHLRINEDPTGERGWLPKPIDLREQTWLASMVTRRPDQYRRRSMARGGVDPLRIPVNSETARCRHALEFWLAPPGEHEIRLVWEHPLAPSPELIPTPLWVTSCTVTPHLRLIIMVGIYPPGEFSDLAPHAEYSISAFNSPQANLPES